MFIDYELIRNNILQKGFHEIYEPEVFGIIDPNQFKLLNVEERSRDNGIKDVSFDLSKRLTLVSQIFKDKYIDPIWPNAKYNKFIIWEGVDNDNKGWHTDMFEGYDIFLLYYLDDTYSESGGAVQFKWKENEDFKESEVQPKRGTLIMVNNCRGFWHRAVDSKIRRRVVSFDFNVGLKDD